MKKILLVLFCLFSSFFAFAGTTDYASGVIYNIEYPLNDSWNDSQDSFRVGIVSGDNLNVEITSSASIRNGQKTATATAPVILSADSTAVRGVTVSRIPTSLGRIYIGSSTVSADNGFTLSKDGVESIKLDVDNLTDVYFNSEANNEGVSWIAEIR